MTKQGQVHLYYGDGKGKTSAAVGLAVRAFGAGFDVLIVQFLKNGSSSEIAALRDRLGIPVFAEKITPRFSFCMSGGEKRDTLTSHEHIWQKAMDWADRTSADKPSPEGRLLVFDELIGAIEAGLFPEEKVLSFLDNRPADLEVVLTGRNPSASLSARADYRSKIICESHPYTEGVPARKGIEF